MKTTAEETPAVNPEPARSDPAQRLAARLPAGSGLELRLPEGKDAQMLSALVEANREELSPWLPWAEERSSPERALVFIRQVRAQAIAGEALAFAVWHQDRLAGMIGLKDINKDGNRSAEIGYWLDRALWGRGIMTAACRALVGHAFSEMGIHRLEIRCAADNGRSQDIPRRLGFVEEGLLRQAQRLHGDYKDLVVFGLLAEEWVRRDAGDDPMREARR